MTAGKHHLAGLYVLIILIIGYMTIFSGYEKPDHLFWDENYHVTAAQKYIDSVMFMEPHPPLGKMILAFGEYVTGANKDVDTSNLLSSDYLKNDKKPEGLSFSGYRLMPVVLMVFALVIFFFILLNITDNAHIAFLFSSLLLFDNALIVHVRSAMLEGSQLFFMLAAILYFAVAIKSGKITNLTYMLLAVFIGLAISIKVNSAILLLLLVFLFVYEQRSEITNHEILRLFKRLLVRVSVSILPIITVFLLCMYVHIASGAKIVNGQTFAASDAYQQRILNGDTYSLSTFILALKDNLRFMAEYADGVPKLDPSKIGENGSFATGWPLGAKTINYRWDRSNSEGQLKARYLYLQSNPVIWISALAGMVLSVGLLIYRLVRGSPGKEERLLAWIFVFATLYFSYMLAILQIERVMYLYHYFVPLMFALINLSLVFVYFFRIELVHQPRRTYGSLTLFVTLIFATFLHFSPLTYYQPLTEKEFQLRQWFDFWELTSVTKSQDGEKLYFDCGTTSRCYIFSNELRENAEFR